MTDLTEADKALCEAAINVMVKWPTHLHSDRAEIAAEIDGDWSSWRGDWVAEAALIAINAALRDKARLEALADQLAEALAGNGAWLERWAHHVGRCDAGDASCTCGLVFARHENRQALAAHTAHKIDG